MKNTVKYMLACIACVQASVVLFMFAHEAVAGSGRELLLAEEGTFFIMVAAGLLAASLNRMEKRE